VLYAFGGQCHDKEKISAQTARAVAGELIPLAAFEAARVKP